MSPGPAFSVDLYIKSLRTYYYRGELKIESQPIVTSKRDLLKSLESKRMHRLSLYHVPLFNLLQSDSLTVLL